VNRPCPNCGTPLDTSVREEFCPVCALRGALGRDTQTPLFPIPSRQIGGYQIIGELARGGVGIVFRARQAGLQREVALKLLIAGQLADTRTRLRFQQEAEAAAKLRHPHIVTVHEVGEHEGQPFIAMELVDGGTLADLVREQPLPALRAAELVLKLALAVEHAHQAGILHRDLKPSNILLDAFAQPRITDFGLARVLASDTRVTLTGQTLGSPSYMAPEQATGDANAIGPAADLYALGAILYQLATTRPPFQGDSAHAVLRRVENEDPVPPRRLNPGVPVDLETVILKCLEKSPARRYATARDLADELERFTKGQPVHARPVSAMERGWRWCRRRPRVAALLLTTLALLGTIAVGSSIAAYRIKRSEHAAQHRLAESLISQARAVRLAGKSGQRDQSLALLREAGTHADPATLRDKLRHEALAALALPELRKTALTNLPASGDIMLTCFNADFTRCFLSPPDGTIRLFDVASGSALLTLPFNTRQVDEVLGFDGSGRYVALRLGVQTWVWDLAAQRASIPASSSLGPGAFSALGAFYARGETNGAVVVYELPSARVHARFSTTSRGGVTGIAWSPDETSLAITTADGSVSARSLTNGLVLWNGSLPSRVRKLVWNPALPQLATLAGGGSVLLLDPGSGAVLNEIRIDVDESASLDFSPDGEWLAVGSESGGIRLFDTRTGKPQLSDSAGTWHLHFDRGGTRLGGWWERGRIGWIDCDHSKVLRTLRPSMPAGDRPVLDFSADGRWLVSATDGGLLVWELPAGRVVARLEARDVFAAGFDPRSQLLAAASQKGLRTWRRDGSGWKVQTSSEMSPSGRRYHGIAFPADGKQLVVADHVAGAVDWVDAATLRVVRSERAIDNLSGLAVSRDGRWLYGGACRPHGAFLWDAERRARVDALPRDAGCQGAFSPDGQWLVTFGHGCSLWRAGSWTNGPALPIKVNNNVEFAAAFHPDGSTLAVTQHDREIHLLDIGSGTRQAVLEAPGEGRIHALRFSPDGHALAAARERGEIQLWEMSALKSELGRINLDWR